MTGIAKLFFSEAVSRDLIPSNRFAGLRCPSELVAMRHYAMATEESFQAAADPDGQTVSRKVTDEALFSDSGDRSISDMSDDIGETMGQPLTLIRSTNKGLSSSNIAPVVSV